MGAHGNVRILAHVREAFDPELRAEQVGNELRHDDESGSNIRTPGVDQSPPDGDNAGRLDDGIADKGVRELIRFRPVVSRDGIGEEEEANRAIRVACKLLRVEVAIGITIVGVYIVMLDVNRANEPIEELLETAEIMRQEGIPGQRFHLVPIGHLVDPDELNRLVIAYYRHLVCPGPQGMKPR